MENLSNLSTLDDIIKAQAEVLENAAKVKETKPTIPTRGTTSIFRYMKEKGIPFPNEKFFPGYHLVIRNPHFKYEYDPSTPIFSKYSWYNRYLNLVLLYVDAEAFNIESIDDSVYPGFCENISEWCEFLNTAVLSHFNEGNTTRYEDFLKCFGKPLKLKMMHMGLDCPSYPDLDNIIYLDRDPEVMEDTRQGLIDKWEQTYYNNAVWLREIYRRNYENADFTKSDEISKPDGLIEAAMNWRNPYFDPENKPIDNGAKPAPRSDTGSFHKMKHAGGRPTKLDYLKGASNELVEHDLNVNGVSKRMRIYYRKRLGNNPIKGRGRPSKYAGMTEEQIVEKMKAEGRSSHDIAQQVRRNKKVQ